MKRSRWIALATVALAVVLATAGTAAGASKTHNNGGYTVTPLVSDQAGMAPTLDPNLVNGWGISAGPLTPWWVANQGTNTSTLYNAAGQRFPLAAPLVVQVPVGPTGTVFNGDGVSFKIPSATGPVSSRFLFATLSGTLQGWAGGPAAT